MSSEVEEIKLGASSAGISSGRALRNAGVYAFATALRGAISFLLLPIYTRVLSPSEYGRLAIILTITTAASIIFSFGLDFAVFRNFFQLASNPAAQRRLVGSLWTFLVLGSMVAALVVSAAVAPWLASSSIVHPWELTIALVGAALFVAATTVPLSLLRAQQRMRDYVVLSLIYTAATVVLTLTFVAGFDAGVTGWLLAVAIANAAGFAAAVRIIPWRAPKPFDRRLVRDGLALGLPLIPHFLGHWALLLADRAILGTIVSTAAVGVYTLAATLALPALILVQALAQAFMPSYAAAAANEADRARLTGIVSVQAISVLAICLAVALLGPNLVALVAPPEYHGAAPLIPWIALGYAFLGLYSTPMNGLSLGMGRTQFVWVATAIAACANIAMIYTLVPIHGIEGAAIASAFGYFVLLVAIGWHSRSPLNPVTYEWRRLLRAAVLLAAVYAAAVLTTHDTGVVGAIARIAWLAVAGAGLVASGTVAPGGPRVLARRVKEGLTRD